MKDKYLNAIATGASVTAFALTEPETGSDAAALKTKATQQSDGTWVLNGRKTFITHADIADIFIVVARSDPHSTGGKGVSVFLVPGDTPGLYAASLRRKWVSKARMSLSSHSTTVSSQPAPCWVLKVKA